MIIASTTAIAARVKAADWCVRAGNIPTAQADAVRPFT